jgi:hypothetical protein
MRNIKVMNIWRSLRGLAAIAALFASITGAGIIKAADTAAVAKPNAPAQPTPPIPIAPAPARPFPKLNLQGVTYTKQNPSVMINGKTLRVGERIHEATVVQIGPHGATVEFDGQFKALTLTK